MYHSKNLLGQSKAFKNVKKKGLDCLKHKKKGSYKPFLMLTNRTKHPC